MEIVWIFSIHFRWFVIYDTLNFLSFLFCLCFLCLLSSCFDNIWPMLLNGRDTRSVECYIYCSGWSLFNSYSFFQQPSRTYSKSWLYLTNCCHGCITSTGTTPLSLALQKQEESKHATDTHSINSLIHYFWKIRSKQINKYPVHKQSCFNKRSFKRFLFKITVMEYKYSMHVHKQRCFDVYTTSTTLEKRRMNVNIT